MEFSNLRVYQPDGTFKTGGLSISGDRIASADVSADAVDMGGLYAVPDWSICTFTAAWAAISATARMRLSPHWQSIRHRSAWPPSVRRL